MCKVLINLFLLLFVCFHMSFANADVFGYSDENGAIYLTDTPSDGSYQLLMVSPIELERIAATVSVRDMSEDESIRASSLKDLLFQNEVRVAAKNSGVDSALLHAVIITESNYNPNAISPKGAKGLMQLMPITASRFGVYNMYDPVQNIQGGARYLAYLLGIFNNDFKLAIAAYNAGENAVIRHGNQVPPYRETVNYVTRVMLLYKKLKPV
jgi:soluble lytic murein transglycosylase-like protein